MNYLILLSSHWAIRKNLILFMFFLAGSILGQNLSNGGTLSIELFRRSSGIEIASIKKNDTELLNTNVNSELFSLTIYNKKNALRNILSSSGWGSTSIVNSEGEYRVIFTDVLDSTLSSKLKITVIISLKDNKSEWDISVIGLEDASLHQVVFPQLNIKAEGNDTFFTSHYGGQEIINPLSNSIDSKLIYPLGWDVSMQFSAYYNNRYGIYLGTHDAKASLKTFVVKAQNGGVIYKNILPIPNKTINGNNWEMSGYFCFELFEGNWYEAAQIYRNWASTEADYWPKDNPLREKRKEALGNIGIWAYAFSEPNYSMAQIEEEFSSFAKNFPGINVGIHWYQWNYLEFDNDYPNYFPELEGMGALVKKLQSNHNIFIMPYINGRLFDQDLPNYLTDGFPNATKKNNGNTYTQNFNGNTFDVMCPIQNDWQKVLIDASYQLTGRINCSGIYLDQVCAATPVECVDSNHNHSLGGGNWWRKGYNEIFKQIHTTLDENKFVTVEGGCDYLADEVDGFLVEGWTSNNLVPAFTAVYGGKVQLLGRATSTANYNNKAYYSKLTQAFTFGIQPGRASTWIVHDPNAENIAKPFLKRIATMRDKLKDYLAFGRMLKPIEASGSIPKITSTWTDYGEELSVTISALQSSVWNDNKNEKVLVLFANASMEKTLQFSFNFIGEDYGLNGQLEITKVSESSDSLFSYKDNSFSKNTSLLPLDIVAYIIEPQESTSLETVNSKIFKYELNQNYPNPFNPSTVIKFSIPKAGETKLEVYNLLGQKVVTLINKKLMQGTYEYKFDGSNFVSGIYIYKLASGGFTKIKKMILLR